MAALKISKNFAVPVRHSTDQEREQPVCSESGVRTVKKVPYYVLTDMEGVTVSPQTACCSGVCLGA
jgi:hypothetical protein